MMILMTMMMIMLMTQVGRMLNKAMKGGLQGDSQTGLTAYVVISLLEANVSRTVRLTSLSQTEYY